MAELTDTDTVPAVPQGPSTHLDNFEEVSTNVSEFAQVIFNNVQECYVPGNDLQCNYTLTSAIKPQSRDWIGVFKVGWTSTRQYRAFEWAPSPSQLTDGDEWTQDITFKAYYLPKDEDGEYYQLCYIDAAGKMRGASTPFQFLEQSADDFIQVLDDSMDILMIHNKSEYCVEELKRVQEEKQGMEGECKSLREKVVTLETELQEAKNQLDSITQEYEACSQGNKSMEEKMKSMTCELAEARERVANLSEEAGHYESSLQQTEGAFMEVVNRELALRNKLDDLEKRYNQLTTDRNTLKTKLESTEKNNSEMCEEIDNLKQLLSHSNETHQEVRESEVRMKEQYVKMQQDLQQASVEKEQLQMMECRFASAESSRVILAKELDSLKMVQEKLSKDLVAAKTEKESLKMTLERQTKEIKAERKKVQLQCHQSREKQALLQEQISALKDGIQQLAQEKEMVSKGTKGSQEAQHIATKDLKDKVRRTQFQCKEEVRRRGELQKKMVAMETSLREENNELKREVEDLRLRLQMGGEEYKKVYSQCRQLEAKLEKKKVLKESVQTLSSSTTSSTSSTSSWKDVEKNISLTKSGEGTETAGVLHNSQASQVVSEQTSQGVQARSSQSNQECQITNQASQAIQATTGIQATNLSTQASQATADQATQGSQAVGGNNIEKGTQSGLPAVALKMEGAVQRLASRDDTFDLKEMHEQMCSLSKELEERKKEVDNFKRMYQEERERSSHSDRVWQLKYQSLESKNTELHDKHNKVLNDYTNMKHSYESLKFDMESLRPAAPSAPETSDRPKQYVNPYAQQSDPTQMENGSPPPLNTVYGNPYARAAEEALPSALMEVSIDSMNLGSIRYPPDMVEDAVLSDASDSIPPALLPEPLQPDVLPEGKIAAIKMMSSQLEGKQSDSMTVQQEQTDDDRDDVQFVDAPEFQEDVTSPLYATVSPPIPTSPPPPPPPEVLEPKKCPECVIEFPPTYPEEDFVKHVQRHFAKLCPVCQGLLDPQISQIDFQRHVERCIMSGNN